MPIYEDKPIDEYVNSLTSASESERAGLSMPGVTAGGAMRKDASLEKKMDGADDYDIDEIPENAHVYMGAGKSLNLKSLEPAGRMKFVTDLDYVFAAVDECGRIAFGLKKDFTLFWEKGLGRPVVEAIEKCLKYTDESIEKIAQLYDDTELCFAVIDSDGVVVNGCRPDGSFVFGSEETLNYAEIEKKVIGCPKPENFCDYGDGSFEHPYTSNDGTAGIASSLANLRRGGAVTLSSADYKITKNFTIKTASTRLCGESMGYQADPLAIHHAVTGSVITLGNSDVCINVNAKGLELSRFGMYGVERANFSEIKHLFDPADPFKNCAVRVSGYYDQGKFEKLCFAMLGAGIVNVDGHFDATIFDNVNFDGCDVGIWCPANGSGSYVIHSNFLRNIFADMTGMAAYIRYLQQGFFSQNHLSGTSAFILDSVADVVGYKCAIYIGGSGNVVAENVLKNPGVVASRVFGETGNDYSDPDCIALVVSGNRHIVTGNRIMNASGKGLVVVGNNGVVEGNYCADGKDDSITISGSYSIVRGNYVVGGTRGSIVINGNSNMIEANYVSGRIIINGNDNKVIYNHASMIEDNGENNTILN